MQSTFLSLIHQAAFRLKTGHDCFAKHLHCIGMYNSPLCTLCNQNSHIDKDHLLNHPLLNEENLYDRYWRARKLVPLAPSYYFFVNFCRHSLDVIYIDVYIALYNCFLLCCSFTIILFCSSLIH